MKRKYLYIFLLLLFFSQVSFGEKLISDSESNILDRIARNEYAKGNLELSLEFYQYVLDLNPTDPTPYLNMASIFKEAGDMHKCVNYLHEGLKLDPQNPKVKVEMARLHLQMGDAINANNILGNIEDRDTLFYKALALIQQSKWSAARTILQRLVLIDNQFAVAQYFLGLCNQEMGNDNEARIAFERALQIERSFTGINLFLGDYYYNAGNLEKALAAYEGTPSSMLNATAGERLDFLRQALRPPVEPSDEERPIIDKVVNFRTVTPLKSKNIPQLRVALLPKSSRLAFQAGSGFVIKNVNNGNIIFEGEAARSFVFVGFPRDVRLFDLEGNHLATINEKSRLSLNSDTTTLAIFDVAYGQGYFWGGVEDRQYRGAFVINPTYDGFFQFINEVNIEEYLLSTVPSEMPASWPLDALKAQAIAARSYTLTRMKSTENNPYHVVESVANAVYKGVTWENNNSSKAVRETIGLVASYNDQVINAVFSANSGGHTEDAEFVWGGKVPYLQAQSLEIDDSVFPHSPYTLDWWIRHWEPAYSFSSRYGVASSYRWTRALAPNEPPVVSKVGRLLEIIPLERGLGGSVNAVKVIGEKGETIIKGDTIRSQLGGLKNNRFIVEPFYMGKSAPEYFLIWGGGWGHNVGLDQTAAAEMAACGFTFDEIVKYFYSGVVLKRLY